MSAFLCVFFSFSVWHRKNWKRRWFVLQDNMLKYYPAVPLHGETAAGYINLSGDTQIVRQDSTSFLLVASHRTFRFMADNPNEVEQWVKVLSNLVSRLGSLAQ
eukprot:m.79443 g.79443  ORF g.79443 m.79443 type:complete len:103 (+) comp8182_c3_seq2:18-326(+)